MHELNILFVVLLFFYISAYVSASYLTTKQNVYLQ